MRTLLLSLLLLGAAPALSAATLEHTSGTVHTPEVDLGYESFGASGPALPIIAVNGGPGLSHAYMVQNDVWQRIAAAGHRVVLYDQRGTGASRHMQPGAPQTMAAQVADLEAIRAHLGLGQVALVGDSYGGMIVMAYAEAHPEHVARLVLSDSPAGAWKDTVHLLPQVFPDLEEQDQAEEKRLGEDTDAAARAGLRNHFRMIFYSPEKRDAYMQNMGDLGFEPQVSKAVWESLGSLDLTPKLAGFHLPVLVINGRYDMNVAPLTAWHLAHEIPGAQLIFFEKSGHLPSYEEPDRYVQVIESFVGGGR